MQKAGKRVLWFLPTICLVILPWLHAQGMEERQVFGGEETVLRFGLDSTSNWWILTQPYERYMRLYVNGYKSAEAEYIMRPVFSPDGLHWGTVTYFQNTVSVLLDGQTLELAYTVAYDLQFADDGMIASVIGYIGGQRELVRFQFADGEWKQKEAVSLPQAFEGSIVQDRSLTRFLCRVSEGNQFSVLMGDRSFGPFDQIHHLRWWQDSLPLFAARNGDWWAVYLGSEPILSSIDTVFSIQLNRDRSVAVIVYKRYQLSYIAKLAPDGQLQQTQGWDKVEDVKLHPSSAVYGALVQWRNQHYFLLDGTRYPVRPQHTKLQMLYDGSGYYCLECRQLCDLMVNGERLVRFDGQWGAIVLAASSVSPTAITAFSPTSSDIRLCIWTQSVCAFAQKSANRIELSVRPVFCHCVQLVYAERRGLGKAWQFALPPSVFLASIGE